MQDLKPNDMKKKKIQLAILLIMFCFPVVFAQSDADTRAKTYSLMAGYGVSSVLDTYLSPYYYNGADYRLLGEFSGDSRSGRFSRQHWISLDYARTTNFSGRGLCHAGFLQYSFSILRQYKPSQNFQIKVGGASDILLGGIYNVRNDNNPAQAKVNLNLDFSGMVDYRFRVKETPLLLSYQLKVPLVGAGFAPEYGQSYYEIFQLGNTSGIVHLLSWQNQWAFQNQLTLEVPLGKHSMRLGYFNNFYQTRIHHLETSVISHNILLGISGDILHLDRRKRISVGKH